MRTTALTGLFCTALTASLAACGTTDDGTPVTTTSTGGTAVASGGTASAGGTTAASGGTTTASGGVAAASGGTTTTSGGATTSSGGVAAAGGGTTSGGVTTASGGVTSAAGGTVATAGGSPATGGTVASPPKGGPIPDNGSLLAFPTAEGFGKNVVGGRGGHVHIVTNLNDSGPGSLRAALGGPSPSTVVFRVGGTIHMKSALSVPSHTTIAGQTAPGGGIALTGYPLKFKGTEIIMRYFRVRLGDGTGYENDAVHGSGGGSKVILDHISASWSVDETFSFYASDLVTIQWCMVTESLDRSIHPKGSHGYGGLWGGPRNTNHHNLFAHHASRSPRFKGNSDYRNNVAYNWVENSAYGGGPQNGSEFNFVGNYYKPGPATPKGEMSHRLVNPFGGAWFVEKNFVFGNPKVTADNWAGGVQDSRGTRVMTPFDYVPINEQPAEEAFEIVLANAGASFPKRDSIDARIVQEVRDGTSTFGRNGIIDTPGDVGGLPELEAGTSPPDGDNDGMPDAWELENGLDPKNAEDRNKTWGPGYTMLEKYINGLLQK